jgi:hypothetical protein
MKFLIIENLIFEYNNISFLFIIFLGIRFTSRISGPGSDGNKSVSGMQGLLVINKL